MGTTNIEGSNNADSAFPKNFSRCHGKMMFAIEGKS